MGGARVGRRDRVADVARRRAGRGRRVVAACLVVLAALTAAGGPMPAGAATSFTDVPPGHPFHTEITWLADVGITTGYTDGGYHPAEPVSRQAMAAFFYRLEGEPPGPFPDPGFTDVPPSHQFFDEIAWLAEEGITTGYTDGGYHPAAPISRQAMAAFFYRLAGPGPSELVSRRTDGTVAESGSSAPSASADGRFVAFASAADNLVDDDTNGVSDIFVRDRQTGLVRRVSVSSGGSEADQESRSPSISATGRYVAFESAATNLSTEDDDAVDDVFRHDLLTGQTVLVSIRPSGVPGDGHSVDPAISGDGTRIAFTSFASSLAALGDTNNALDVFVADLEAGTLVRHSVDSAEDEADGASERPALSSDGRWLAFRSAATDLIADDGNGLPDVFLRSLEAGTTVRVSGGDGTPGDPESDGTSDRPDLSGTGRFITFSSHATNLVPDDSNGAEDQFVHDRVTGTTVRVSVGPDGGQLAEGVDRGVIDDLGRYVAFTTEAAVDPGDGNGAWDVYRIDLRTGRVVLASSTPTGAAGDGDSMDPAISGDGQVVAFSSEASDLTGDPATAYGRVFVRRLGI